jgi:phospholipase C
VSKGSLNRRAVLRAGVAGAAGLGLGAFGSAAALAGTTAGPRQPGSLPYPALSPGTDTIPQLQHIVVVMMENHSYDNRLGTLRRPGADGFTFAHGAPTATNPYANGDVQHAFRMPTTCQLNGKPSQEWTASHLQFDGGLNDGFVTSPSGPVAMGYWDTPDQPFYHSLARAFPIADRYFCSVLGQTFPNRRYLIAATSIGQIDDTTPALTDYPKRGTIFDALGAAGVTWKDYYSSTLELDGTTLPAATTLLYPAAFFKNPARTVPITEFFADAAAGTLPGYCIVEPDFGVQSEENPQNIAVGEAFVASVVNAVMSGPGWSKTLLIWTYDEHGGYYDHVPPPAALAPDDIPPDVQAISSTTLPYNGFAQYGFRVPFAIVSPYARPSYVSHQVMDHTSICALVEAKWNLPAMTLRDANAVPPLDMLDFDRAAFAAPPALAPPLLDIDPSALACNVDGAGTIPPPGSMTAA